MTFASLGLSKPILDALLNKGYETPSPIQAQAIPAIIAGQDVMAAAQTGTGKTAGFTLPILQRLSVGERAAPNQVRALILTPTRELAAQVAESVRAYSINLPGMRSAVVFGGVNINPQMMALRKGVDVLVATPGRLLDLYNQNAIKFKQLEVLVLDEADRMLDMGFIRDIRKILALLPKQRQNLMFSATFSDDIRQLAKSIVHSPLEISVSPPNSATKLVRQWIVPVDKSRKVALLTELITNNNWQQALVFSRTKHGANKLAEQLLNSGITSAAIHGNKSQGARTKALADFKTGKVRILVATDIAARGIDISQLPQVVNFDLPDIAEDYVHRIGRTGRAGSDGEAVSLVSVDETYELVEIEKLLKHVLPREIHAGFEPQEPLPETYPGMRVPKPKRPQRGSGNQRSPREAGNSRSSQPSNNNGARRSNTGSRSSTGVRSEGNRQQPAPRAGNTTRPTQERGSSAQTHREANGNRNGNVSRPRTTDVNGNRSAGNAGNGNNRRSPNSPSPSGTRPANRSR